MGFQCTDPRVQDLIRRQAERPFFLSPHSRKIRKKKGKRLYGPRHVKRATREAICRRRQPLLVASARHTPRRRAIHSAGILAARPATPSQASTAPTAKPSSQALGSSGSSRSSTAMAPSLKSLVSSVLGGGGGGGGDGSASTRLFAKTDPAVDGDDCLRDCDSCTVRYPRGFSVDVDVQLYGHVKGWSTHVLVATSKADWVRDVADERGSVMEAVAAAPAPANGVRARPLPPLPRR